MEIRISFSNVVGKRLALGYTHFYSDDREPETVGGGGGGGESEGEMEFVQKHLKKGNPQTDFIQVP